MTPQKGLGRLSLLILITGFFTANASDQNVTPAATTNATPSTTSSPTNAIAADIHTETKKWSAEVDLSMNADTKEVDQSTNLEMLVIGGFKWNKTHSTSLKLGAKAIVTPKGEAAMEDTFLSHSVSGPDLPGKIKLNLGLRATAPTSKESRDAHLITSLRFQADFKRCWYCEGNAIGIGPFLYYTQNFHTAKFGGGATPSLTPNVQLAVRPGISGEFNFKKFHFETTWSYVYKRTYFGAIRHDFTSNIEAGMNVTKAIYLGLGLGNVGSTTRNGGLTDNVTIFNRDMTEMYLTSKVTF